MEASRKLFEEKMFNRHFISTIKRTGMGGCCELMPDQQETLTKAELCKRDGDDYERPEMSAMWFGWKEAMKVSTTYTEAVGQAGQEYCESFGPGFTPHFPGTFRWATLFEYMAHANEPHPFKPGDKVHFSRNGFEFMGIIADAEDKAIICRGIERWRHEPEPYTLRITFLQSLRVVSDEEWKMLVADAPAMLGM